MIYKFKHKLEFVIWKLFMFLSGRGVNTKIVCTYNGRYYEGYVREFEAYENKDGFMIKKIVCHLYTDRVNKSHIRVVKFNSRAFLYRDLKNLRS